MGLKQRCYTGLQKNFQAETKVFLGSRRHNWAETIAKSNKNYQVKSHKGSTFFKKGPHFGQNSRPEEFDPYLCDSAALQLCLWIILIHQLPN